MVMRGQPMVTKLAAMTKMHYFRILQFFGLYDKLFRMVERASFGQSYGFGISLSMKHQHHRIRIGKACNFADASS
ncbi:hypothetical protein AAHA92_31263 [Salvia divinorum]|uniref:Uncharacterized protein n=1 Tax=Salvia divinorum TaxID=28513 RepID=A0ABD1FW39_SALDI